MAMASLRGRVLGLTAALLVGCGGQQSSTAPLAPAAQGPLQRSGLPAKAGSYLYAAACCRVLFQRSGITVYDRTLSGVARYISKGAANPYFLAVDGTGRLYIVDRSDRVVEYDAGSKGPSRRIKLKGAWVAATDHSNTLYIAACQECVPYGPSGDDSVDVYESGTSKFLRTIRQGIHEPVALAIDTNGNLYVANESGPVHSVTVYAPGSTKIVRRFTRGLTSPAALALDASNNLFVMNLFSPTIVEYKAGSNKVLRTITNGISSPQAISVDALGNLYVANAPGLPSKGWISVYAPAASSPNYEITDGIDHPIALAVDGDGNLYVASDHWQFPRARGSISVYTPNTQTPLRSVRGDRFGYPIALAVSPESH
jgi:sugar lactone lactonase YvrE